MTKHRLQVVLNHLKTPIRLNFNKTSASEYFYTLNNNFLTVEQRKSYEENGFLVVPKLIQDSIIDECRDRFVDICEGKVEKGLMSIMKERSLKKMGFQGEFLCYKMQDISWDEVFYKYFAHAELLKYIECFTGPDITVMNSMLINKPPDVGNKTSVHPIHQDLHYFNFRPAERIVGTWTAMERVTKENGCLFVLPGTHKSDLQLHVYPENEVNVAFYGIRGFDKVPKLYLELEKGDTVFFHPLLMHGSELNMTKSCRKAISGHYAANSCYFINTKNTSQENIRRDLMKLVELRNLDCSLEDLWRIKQKIIQGKPGTIN